MDGGSTVMAARYEYKVEEIREGMLGGKMSGDKLEKVLNEYAGKGSRRSPRSR
jgi:hypothetical protein